MKKFLNNIKFLATLLLLTQFEVKAQTYYPAVMNLTVDAGGMGNAVANLPIFCAPGRLNVQPAFGLSYNSSSQSGLCGLGWNLNGISIISRTGRNYHLDEGVQEGILFNTRDLFLLDGQRLLLTSGNYGQNGSTYQTEQDAFARITYANNQFVIENKNGGKSFYGTTQDSKQFPVGNSTHVLNWYQTKTYDANGNFIEYLYETIDDQVLLKEIRYTGFDCTLNGTVTCTEPQEATFNSILFTYITRNQSKDRRFINGSLFVSNKLLT